MFKVLNLVKCLIVVIQFKNNIHSEIYRQVSLSQVYEIKVSEGTACVTWNEEYVISSTKTGWTKNSHQLYVTFCRSKASENYYDLQSCLAFQVQRKRLISTAVTSCLLIHHQTPLTTHSIMTASRKVQGLRGKARCPVGRLRLYTYDFENTWIHLGIGTPPACLCMIVVSPTHTWRVYGIPLYMLHRSWECQMLYSHADKQDQFYYLNCCHGANNTFYVMM